MPGRTAESGGGYRFGFNGMLKDDEIYQGGNAYDFGARIYDARLGRFMSVDPHYIDYPSQSDYSSFNNSPIFFVDPDGKNGVAYKTTDKKGRTLYVIKAYYYYKEANDMQKDIMGDVSGELNSIKKLKINGEQVRVKFDVNFIQSNDPENSAKSDVTSEGYRYGNVAKFNDGHSKGGEDGLAQQFEIEVFQKGIKSNSLIGEWKDPFVIEESEKNMTKSILLEEVLHNVGGLHQDEGALPFRQTFNNGKTTMTDSEKPAMEKYATKKNYQRIFNRIDKPLGTDKNSDIELRDESGTVGKVTSTKDEYKE